MSAFANQIQNRNFLAPVGFKFDLGKFPKASFFSNSARIPEIVLGTIIQPGYLKDIEVPGEKLQYGDFSFRFFVDESLENYMAIHNWLTGLGFPETPQEFIDKTTDEENQRDMNEQFSDGSLRILNSNFQTLGIVKFADLYPTSITSLEFDATESDINFFTAEATFKYTIYNIVKSDHRTRL